MARTLRRRAVPHSNLHGPQPSYNLAELRLFLRRLDEGEVFPPVPPPLPPGRVVNLPGRGETFVREKPGEAGAPTVLLLHGWTVSADLNWFRVYDDLGPYHVIALDHRGHGRGLRTEEPFRLEDCADDAAALLDALGIQSCVAVGYSMGGPIGMLLARRHPHLVSGLVVAATALSFSADRWERYRWRLIGLGEFLIRLSTGRGLAGRILREMMRSAPELVPYRPWLAAELQRGDPGDLADAGRALGAFDATDFAHEIEVPLGVIITTGDRLVRPKNQRRLAAAFGAQCVSVEGDHDTAFVHGDELAKAIRVAVDAVTGRGQP